MTDSPVTRAKETSDLEETRDLVLEVRKRLPKSMPAEVLVRFGSSEPVHVGNVDLPTELTIPAEPAHDELFRLRTIYGDREVAKALVAHYGTPDPERVSEDKALVARTLRNLESELADEDIAPLHVMEWIAAYRAGAEK